MVKQTIAVVFTLIIAAGCQARQQNLDQPVYDIDRGSQTNLSQMATDLKKNRIILVGEHHSNKSHHRAQLAVIQALVQAGTKVAIGLEMFRDESQSKLDQWISSASITTTGIFRMTRIERSSNMPEIIRFP